MTVLPSLDDADARRPEVAGVKAARLAAARAAGLPVLPGLIVPAAAGAAALAAGRAALERGERARARSAAMGAPVEPSLAAGLEVAAALGDELVVRSSTRLDDDPTWAGAFASYLDVEPPAIATAVRGCWASLFAPHALERLERAGLGPAEVGLAVLIQPRVHATAGGWARVTPEAVELAAVTGDPAPLLGGWARGARARVTTSGSVEAVGPAFPLGPDLLRRLVELARRASSLADVEVLEWVVTDRGLLLLQLGRAAANEPTAPAPASPAFDTPATGRLAAVLVGRQGPLADRLLAGWAAAAPANLEPAEVKGAPAELLAKAERLADELDRQVARRVGLEPPAVAVRLADADAALAAALADVRVERQAATVLLGAVEALGRELTGTGYLPAPEAIWWQTTGWLHRAVAPGARPLPAKRRLGDRWADLVFGVVAQQGRLVGGVAAAPGRATGRACAVGTQSPAATLRAGDVVVIEHPTPELAPLLWEAGALVARAGSPAAHLCAVARALHVPAVVAAELGPLEAGTVLAVDGDRGAVWSWRP